MWGLEVVQHLASGAGLAIDHLHRAGEPAREDHLIAFGRGAHRVFQRHAGGMHPRGFTYFSRRAVDCAIGEHVGDVDSVLATIGDHADSAGQRQLADDNLLGGAGLGIDLLDAVIGHIGHEDAILVVDRKIVERRLELRDHLLRAGFRIDPDQLAECGIHDPQVALGIEIDGRRNLETICDDAQLGLVDVHLGDLALEPQRTVQLIVRSELESVEAAHLLHDHARRLDAFDVDLVQRIPKEHGGGVKPAVVAVGERVDSGQTGSELLDRAITFARIQVAGEKAGPGHGAVGRKRNVIGHAFGRRHYNFGGPVIAVDLIERRARDAAREQTPRLVHSEPVHAMKGRAGNQLGDFICLR